MLSRTFLHFLPLLFSIFFYKSFIFCDSFAKYLDFVEIFCYNNSIILTGGYEDMKTRLIKFSVENYKSFYKKQEVVFNEDEKNVTAFFGPNSAGKSNLFSAMRFYCDFILHSADFKNNKNLDNDFFKYTDDGNSIPTIFSAEFKNDVYRYRYTFSISRPSGNVDVERLQRKSVDKDSVFETIFTRKSLSTDRYKTYNFTSSILNETRDDSLILTRAYAINNKIASDVISCIENIMFYTNIDFTGFTAEQVSLHPEIKDKVLKFLKKSDLYIHDFSVKQNSDYKNLVNSGSLFNEKALKLLKRSFYDVQTMHTVRDKDGNVIGTRNMSLSSDESNGTKQIFDYAYPIIKSLEEGAVLYIDELEVNLHPKECLFIINLFNSNNTENIGNGQLIINTHETALMDVLGKDNIYLLGKDKMESTVANKMTGVRTDDKNLSKKYNTGLFGAVPRIGR